MKAYIHTRQTHIHTNTHIYIIHVHCIVLHCIVSIHSFIHTGQCYSAPSSPLLLRGAPDYSTDTVSEFHAEVPRQLQVGPKGLAQGPYVAARAGIEPTTLRLKVIDSTKAPPCSTFIRRFLKRKPIRSVSNVRDP